MKGATMTGLSEKAKELSKTMEKLGDTPLHIIIYKKWGNELQSFIETIPADKRLSEYLICNRNGINPLEEAIDQGNREMARRILNSLKDDEEKLMLLKTANSRGWTVLHRAIYKNDEELVRVLLRTIPPTYRKDLALTTDSGGSSFLLKSSSLPDAKTFKCILSLIFDDVAANGKRQRECLHELLLWKDKEGNTILHNIAMKGNSELLTYAVSLEKCCHNRLKLIRSADEGGRTLLHVAVENANEKMVTCIFDLLRINNQADGLWFDLLYTTDMRSQTALHYAARTRGTNNGRETMSMLATMLHALTFGERITLLEKQDRERNTALHEAIRVKNTPAIRMIVESVDPTALNILLRPCNIHSGMLPELTRIVTPCEQPEEGLARPVQEEGNASSQSGGNTSCKDVGSVNLSQPDSCVYRNSKFVSSPANADNPTDQINQEEKNAEAQMEKMKVPETTNLTSEEYLDSSITSSMDSLPRPGSNASPQHESGSSALTLDGDHSMRSAKQTLRGHPSFGGLIGPGDSAYDVINSCAKGKNV